MLSSNITEHIQSEFSNGVLHIQLNRPEKKNALTPEMYQALSETINQGEEDDAVRVILLSGAGENFTAGNDLAGLKGSTAEKPSPGTGYLFPTFLQAKKPIIAAVNGFAIGIGTTMLLHCDLVYADQATRFRMPFVNLGLCPEFGSSLILPQLMGHQRAAELLLLGDFFDAATARELGIINSVCADGDVLSMALDKARQLAEQPPASIRLTKALLKHTNKTTLEEFISFEMDRFRERKKSPEAAEAQEAFAQRRKPDFSSFK
jgi:enoyl-CoA hydratase/carnithine racemase